MSCVSEEGDEDRASSDDWGSVERGDGDEEGDDGEILKTFLESQGKLDDEEGEELSPASLTPSFSAVASFAPSPGQVQSFSFTPPAASSWPAGL